MVPVRFRAVTSPGIGFSDWRDLVLICERLVADHPDLAGIVIGHGTATLEETAYALSLTLTIDRPVVVVGSQRPISALSSDAPLNSSPPCGRPPRRNPAGGACWWCSTTRSRPPAR